MNETRGNARTKPMRGGLKGGEINSLKDSEKTNDILKNYGIAVIEFFKKLGIDITKNKIDQNENRSRRI